MSVIAGIYHYDRSSNVDEKLAAALKAAISRSPENTVTEHACRGFYMVHADVGAFEEPSNYTSEDGSTIFVAGQVILGTRSQGALSELQECGAELWQGKVPVLRKSRGTFNVAAYHPEDHSLVLGVDRLGVRPLYYYDNGSVVFFSTVLRIVEAVNDLLKLDADLQAITEINAFGYPLADRTPFKGLKCFRGGTARSWSRGQSIETTYWRWDEVPDRISGGEDAAKDLHRTFLDAICARNNGDKVVNAFLSGGLDSRCVVTALQHLGVKVHTYNISWTGSYDHLIGAHYAKHIGALHHEVTLADDEAGWALAPLITSTLKVKSKALGDSAATRSRVVWSGDGGSVGVGRVYITSAIAQPLRSGDIEGAVRQLFVHNKISLCGGTFHRRQRELYESLLFDSVRKEIADHKCGDPAKALFMFLLENDQRRHMAHFYEDVDVNRVEYMMPFFDAEFLSASIALPFDEALYHAFYVKEWLPTFGQPILEVPWQVYPGHEPCPVHFAEEATYQWQRPKPALSFGSRCSQVQSAFKWALSPALPSVIFSRTRLFAVGLSALIKGDNYSYLFNYISKFAYYFKICKP